MIGSWRKRFNRPLAEAAWAHSALALRALGQRNSESECGSLPRTCAEGMDRSTMRFDDSLGDVQAEAGALVLGTLDGCAIVNLDEWLEESSHLVWPHARPGITDIDFCRRALYAELHIDAAVDAF